jgi:hypothetical protein
VRAVARQLWERGGEDAYWTGMSLTRSAASSDPQQPEIDETN